MARISYGKADDCGNHEETSASAKRRIGELSVYWVFGNSSRAWLSSKEEPTKAQMILDECSERLAPEIEAKARELWLDKLEKADAADILSNAFYDIMEKVFRGEDK